MGVNQIRGIVIQEQPQGENNKHMLVLAKGVGKVRLCAKGAKKTKSPLLAGTQLFCYCDFTLFEGRGFASVTQADLIESFYDLRTDMEMLSQAMYLAELADRICPDNMEHDAVLRYFLLALQKMTKGNISPKLVGRILEIKWLQVTGFLASVACMECGKGEPLFFAENDAVFLCEKHRTAKAKPLSDGVVQAMQHVLYETEQKIFSFAVSDDVLQELDWIMRRYLQVHLGLDLKSRRFMVDI